MELQKLSAGQVQKSFSNASKEIAKQEAKQEKPQLKEHCSSKVANALRGAVMGLALAAGVTAGAKAMPVQAAENQPANNITTVSEEQEANVQKTDVEMAVDEALEQEEQKESSLYVGDKFQCSGEMTNEDRAYEFSAISGGNLIFYDRTTTTQVVPVMRVVNGHSQMSMQTRMVSSDKEVNSFNLGTNAEKSTITLRPGERYDEVSGKNGDYVILSEDGKTFMVYDSEDKVIGSCEYQTSEEHDEMVKNGLILFGVPIGGTALTIGGFNIVDNLRDKHSKKRY